MPLEFPRFTVYLRPDEEDADPIEHDVVVNFQDQTRVEPVLSKMGLTMRGAPLTTSTAWCWAALTRTGRYKKTWDQFLNFDCMGIEDPDKAAGGEGGATVTVDPTPQVTPDGSP